ncbi:beta-glucosidase [Labilibaculum manganireducens]|uniref:beta-glucosidase n=1 Tax=Labilibaculum manganireducens TaxID=1940525 RepID=A0A2N3HQK7_9BACT|nr:glycoside hydrolase family 3 N-terminal domain-containing protein [Labilibaculum manganireducens]PKQ60323.1 beta-glucosidase [Labilibaculum manganireducens]
MRIINRKNLKSRAIGVFLLSCSFTLMSGTQIWAQGNSEKVSYKDANFPIEKRINDLVSQMTLKEKVMQLNQFLLGKNNNPNNMGGKVKRVPAEIGSLIYTGIDPVFRNAVQRKAMEESRLGIPIIFGYDVIHGLKTVYSIPLAQACSWNTELTKSASAMAAKESKLSGIDWTFSPMVDVARDPRWGRVAEGYGEDPYTNAQFAIAAVKGYQGDQFGGEFKIAACLKHFVGYGASEGGRDYVYTEISKQTLWDTYLPSFEAGIDAGAATVMSAFNDISGVPASSNHYTMTKILKEKWQHDGFIVSDWGAVQQLVAQGVAEDKKEAVAKAFNAGLEMDMADKVYKSYLEELVNEGKVSLGNVDEAVKRVLRVKFKLGLFDHPYVPELTDNERYLLPEYLKIGEQIAEESIVLLKNENNTLPLAKSKKVAVIGPLAKDTENLLGCWAGQGEVKDVAASIYSALEKEFKTNQLSYAKGCDFDGDDIGGFAEASNIAQDADVILLCLGEKARWTGESSSRSTLSLPEIQEQLLFELKKLGKPIVLVLSNGRPLELNRIEPLCDAIVEMWQPGVAGGNPVARVLSGRVNPSGKLAMTFPYSTGQIPIYYNMRQSARPRFGKYQDIQTTPLYEFTYGLSYTTFEYGELKASVTQVKRGDKLSIQIPVTNTGKREGMETVHWFISDPASSISRPLKELKYFEKKNIKAGETTVFSFDVDLERDFGFVDDKGDRFMESGIYNILVKDKNITIELVD